MRKPVVAVALTLLGVALMAGPAYGAFTAKEAKEKIITLSNSESAIAFRVPGTKEKELLEVICKTVKAEGAVMTLPGLTGAEAKEDSPASTPATKSTRIGLTPKFEGCEEVLGKEKAEAATVKAETCQLEVSQEAKTELALVALRAATAEKSCKLTLERAKCVVTASTGALNENDNLEGLKLKNKAASEVEIESGSEVKGVHTTSSGCVGIAEKAEGSIVVKKALVLKGVELEAPVAESKPLTKDYYGVPEVAMGGTSEEGILLTFTREPVKVEMNTIVTLFPALNNSIKLRAGSDTCVNAVAYKIGEQCTYTILFQPDKAKQSYLGEVKIKASINGAAAEKVDAIVGKSL